MNKDDKINIGDLKPGDVIWYKTEWLIVDAVSFSLNGIGLDVTKLDGSIKKPMHFNSKKEFTLM